VRFLHTSDWHIGRTVRSKSRRDEQERVLQEVIDHARTHAIDCLLVSGDLFDSSAPAPESERLVYSFFRELHGSGIPAVVIAGNHDHPMRFEALSHLLRALSIHLIGHPAAPTDGGVIELPSRDGEEGAVIAALPWVAEREAVDFTKLQEEPGAPLAQYAERLSGAMTTLTASFRPDTCNLLLAHLLVNNAVVGFGGGERELHMSMGIYGIPAQMIPAAPQYTALGHVHKPQAVRKSPAAYYSGSLLQLDFGEREQDKSVNLIQVHPRRPAEVSQLPITAGRRLVDIGTSSAGVALNDLAAYAELYPADKTWLRVYVEVDTPVGNLPALVREVLPNAVHIERVGAGAARDHGESLAGLGPLQVFDAFYRSDLGRGREPSPETRDLFRRLLEEETSASPQT